MHSQKRVGGNHVLPLKYVKQNKYCNNSWIPFGLVVQAMDFVASISGFEARLCNLIFFIYLESNAVILLEFWRPQPTLPCFGLQYSISKKTRTERFHFLQCRGSSPSLRFVNRHGGTLRRAGWVAFTKTYSRGKWLISHLPPTFAIIIHIPRPLRPCIWRPRVPVPHFPVPYFPTSHTWCPQVPCLASHFYTQPLVSHKRVGIALQATVETLYEK